jgi:hypothetical protein
VRRPVLITVVAAGIALICVAGGESTPRGSETTSAARSSAQNEKPGASRVSGARPCAGGGYLGTDVSPPIGFSIFHIRTAWLGRRGRRFVNVYAGALWKRPERGLVALMEIPVTNGRLLGQSGWFAPPIKRDGPLSISCVRRNTVYLRSRHLRYAFDLRKPEVRLLHATNPLG